MMKHPVTGEDVPDPLDRVIIYKYLNARAAEWPEADYIVSNPPFPGKLFLVERLGDGYIEAFRDAYKNQVPDGADFVMYWWHKAAILVANNQVKRFGLITSNSISQSSNRRVVSNAINSTNSVSLIFVIPDHPWIESSDAASVRIAMTACELGIKTGTLVSLISEQNCDSEEIHVNFTRQIGTIYEDLRIGTNITSSTSLQSNYGIAGTGLLLGNRGFVINREQLNNFTINQPSSKSIINLLFNGDDISERSRDLFVIDTHGLTEENLASSYPAIYQHLRDFVYAERQVNRDPKLRKYWWLFRRSNEKTRESISGLKRFIVTSETSKHRVFVFLDSDCKPEHKLVVIGSEDSYVIGVLSSKVHVAWALSCAAKRGITPVYPKNFCFDRFPFPDPTPEQKQKIRELGDRLDSHRKQVQAAHPDITITGMYNLLEKLRAGEPFTDIDRAYNNRALVSTL
uniref:type IIL restriction-modification enzyme MmeI n=1 Tax=Chamaesiphon sp. VAR_48_metabat_403 TaxID=2964700 RepID=UPI0037C0F770